MSGETELKTEAKILKFIDDIQVKLDKLHITHADYPKDIKEALNTSTEELRGLSEEACGIHGVIIHRYALYVQQEANKAQATLKAVESYIATLVAKEYDNYGDKYTKYEVKRSLVLSNHSHGEELNRIHIETQALNDSFSSLAYKMTSIGNSMIELQKTKRFSNKQD